AQPRCWALDGPRAQVLTVPTVSNRTGETMTTLRRLRSSPRFITMLVVLVAVWAFSARIASADPVTVIAADPTGTFGRFAASVDPAATSAEGHGCYSGGPANLGAGYDGDYMLYANASGGYG